MQRLRSSFPCSQNQDYDILASAEEAEADYFCTCDDKFLRKAKAISDLKVKAVSPLELIEVLEDDS